MKQLGLSSLVLILVIVSGCARWQQCRQNVTDHHRAKRALTRDKTVPASSRHSKDFRRGYVVGYRDVAQGGDGTPPLLPPKRYATAKHRNARGRDAANTWFLGFQHGAIAAERSGVGQFHHLPASPAYCAGACSGQSGFLGPPVVTAPNWPSGLGGGVATGIPHGFVQDDLAPLPPVIQHADH